MGLKDALENITPIRRGPSCSICSLMETLPKEDKVALVAALDDPINAATSISRALKAEGYVITDKTVQRHRRGDCFGKKS